MAEAATMEATEQTKTEVESSQTAVEDKGTTLVTEPAKEPATEETQTTEKAAEATKAADETKPEGAPEKYEFQDADKYDQSVLATFSDAAKEANLSQDAAQKLLAKVAPALEQRIESQVESVQNEWTESSKTDKEFGGEKLKENLGIAKKALDQFGSPELKKFLDDSGLGNHPEVIRMLWKVGKAISEDTFVGGAPGTTKGTVDAANVLYDNTKKE